MVSKIFVDFPRFYKFFSDVPGNWGQVPQICGCVLGNWRPGSGNLGPGSGNLGPGSGNLGISQIAMFLVIFSENTHRYAALV